jgi:membrane protein implicated in regulation of membrane protease activity
VITIDLANSIFVGCLIIGGGLLLLTVLVDDILGGILDALHVDFDIGGVSLMPLLLGFVSMFGVGGLIGTEVLRLDGGRASLVGLFAGLSGTLFVYFLFGALKRAEAPPAFSLRDLVGQRARVTVGIRQGHQGSVLLNYGGSTHDVSATASLDIPAGATVLIVDLAGATLIVEPAVRPVTPATTEGG